MQLNSFIKDSRQRCKQTRCIAGKRCVRTSKQLITLQAKTQPLAVSVYIYYIYYICSVLYPLPSPYPTHHTAQCWEMCYESDEN